MRLRRRKKTTAKMVKKRSEFSRRTLGHSMMIDSSKLPGILARLTTKTEANPYPLQEVWQEEGGGEKTKTLCDHDQANR